MSLAKLLSAGSSFFGGGASAPYRKNKRVYVPKFGSGGNPFSPKDKPAEPAPAVEPAPATPASAQKISVPPAPVSAVMPAPVPVAKPAAKPGRNGWLNPFRPPQPAPSPAVSAVQSELSLEGVKVLHNDLSDADVDVVPLQSRTVKAPAADLNLAGEPALRPI